MATFSEKHNTSLEIATFLKNNPWAEEYNGLDSETLRKYLEVSYLAPNGQPFPRDKDFYDNIIGTIQRETIPPPLTSQQIPHFASLLVDFVKEYENKKNQGLKKSKIIPQLTTDPKTTTKAALQYWELRRQEILLEEIKAHTRGTLDEITHEISTALSGDVEFASYLPSNPTLADDIATNFNNRLLSHKTTDIKKLLEEALTEELEKILPAPEAKRIAADVTQDIPEPQIEEITLLSEMINGLKEAQDFTIKYKEHLYDKVTGAAVIRNQSFEQIQTLAEQKTALFAEKLIPSLQKAGFSDEEIDKRLPKFIDDIVNSTAKSPEVASRTYSQNNFRQVLLINVKSALLTHLNPQGVRSAIPIVGNRIGADENRRLNEIYSVVQQEISKDIALQTILKTASYNTYAVYNGSIEGGDPLGRIPHIIKLQLLGASSSNELNAIVQDIILKHSSGTYSLSPSQITALNVSASMISDFQKSHPRLATISSFYYRHTVGFSIAKSFGSQILFHPDYSLYIPGQLLNIWWSNEWQLKLKPHLIEWSINNAPFGKVVGLWYKKGAWGLYENPLERVKHRAEKFVIGKGLSLVGHASIKIGSLFGKPKIEAFGASLLVGELVGKIAGIWTIGKAVMGKVAKWVGAGILATFLWATTYGIPGLIGFGASLTAGAALGIKAGIIAAGVGGPIVGFVVGAVTTLVVTFLGTAATAWVLDHGLLPSLSQVGPNLSSALGQIGHGLTATTGQAVLVSTVGTITIVGGGTLLATSFLQVSFNPYRDTTQTSTIPMDPKLNDLFQQAATDPKICIPVAALKAISQIEASGVWSYTESEIATFSQDGWWNGASQSSLEKGYCVDTCQKSGVDCALITRATRQYGCETAFACSETTVYGPMQFEELTWGSRLACGQNPDRSYTNDCLMKRCNLQTSITEAAKKIKSGAGAGSSCTSWDETTVKAAAKAYCGSCGVTPTCGPKPPEPWPDTYTICYNANKACGDDYCTAAWRLYNDYK